MFATDESGRQLRQRWDEHFRTYAYMKPAELHFTNWGTSCNFKEEQFLHRRGEVGTSGLKCNPKAGGTSGRQTSTRCTWIRNQKQQNRCHKDFASTCQSILPASVTPPVRNTRWRVLTRTWHMMPGVSRASIGSLLSWHALWDPRAQCYCGDPILLGLASAVLLSTQHAAISAAGQIMITMCV